MYIIAYLLTICQVYKIMVIYHSLLYNLGMSEGLNKRDIAEIRRRLKRGALASESQPDIRITKLKKKTDGQPEKEEKEVMPSPSSLQEKPPSVEELRAEEEEIKSEIKLREEASVGEDAVIAGLYSKLKNKRENIRNLTGQTPERGKVVGEFKERRYQYELKIEELKRGLAKMNQELERVNQVRDQEDDLLQRKGELERRLNALTGFKKFFARRRLERELSNLRNYPGLISQQQSILLLGQKEALEQAKRKMEEELRAVRASAGELGARIEELKKEDEKEEKEETHEEEKTVEKRTSTPPVSTGKIKDMESKPKLTKEERSMLKTRAAHDEGLKAGGARYKKGEGVLELTTDQIKRLAKEKPRIMPEDFDTEPERVVAQTPEVQAAHEPALDKGEKLIQLESILPLVSPEARKEIEGAIEKLKGESDKAQRDLEIARLKAEIAELNKIVQKSEAMSRFGHDHKFNKEETYKFIEEKILENEKKIRELEGGGEQKKAGPEEIIDEPFEPAPAVVEEPPKPLRGPKPTVLKEPLGEYGEVPPAEPTQEEIDRGARTTLRKESAARFGGYYEAEKKRGKWWGWVKERLKGFATLGIWEFHQAERFRSNTKEVSKMISGEAEKIRRTEKLSLEDALGEAETMRIALESGGNLDPRNEDYEKVSNLITQGKEAQNRAKIEEIVEGSKAELSERLKKYRDEWGEKVVFDEKKMKDFESNLRDSLAELKDGRVAVDDKRFKEVIRSRLDPKYWRRYVYGGVEAVLDIALLTQVVVPAASKWWLGRKAVQVGAEVGSRVGTHVAETATDSGNIPMKDTIWKSSKEWLMKHGVNNPTNNEIMQVSKQIAGDNGVGVNIWNIAGNPLDSHMQQGFLLKFGGASKILNAIRLARLAAHIF